MSIPMKCEKCGAVSGFAPRFPCVHPPCDGERYLDKDALRTEVLTELSPAPAAPGVDGEMPQGALLELGGRLADLLDADHWNNIEPMLLQIHAEHRALIDAARQEERVSRYGDVILGYISDIGALKEEISTLDRWYREALASSEVWAAETEKLRALNTGVIGNFRCDKCGFVLQKNTLNPETGAVGVRPVHALEDCPNGCGSLRSSTWRDLCMDARQACDARNVRVVELAQQAERYAPLVALVKEWQEARKEWEACKPGPFPWSAENKAKADRIDRAEGALAAWHR